MIVAVTEWRPDAEGLNVGWAVEMTNVLPAAEGAIPFKQLQALTEALEEQPLGAIAVRTNSGTVHIFAGTTDKLWKLDNADGSWDDVSKAATTYAATEDEPWRFKPWGDSVVAVNINDDPQEFVLSSSTEFDDLAGNPPRARHIADFRNMLGLMNDDELFWSDTNDIYNWTPGGASNAGSQPFPSGGIIMGATDETNPIVFQRHDINIGTYQPGSDEIFTFKNLGVGRGCAAPYSICSRDGRTFFADTGGFFQISAGGVTPIGVEKIDRTIFEALPAPELSRIRGEVDPVYSRVYFALNVSGSSAVYDRILIYDWVLQRWTMARFPASLLVPLLSGTAGASLDGLTDNIDTYPLSFDAKALQGGAPTMACFDADFKLGVFQGQNLEAKITVREAGDTTRSVTWVDNIMPIVDALHVTMYAGTRMMRGKPYTWSNLHSINEETGFFDVRIETRFLQCQFIIPAGEAWSLFQGADIPAFPAGER